MNPILTIFTPTYNRGYILPRLYESLKLQTNKNFIWTIVDDGSNDNTEKIIEAWKRENIINIEYIRQENQGKHIAHNTALHSCSTKLFFCVDSDDYLLKNAVEDIYGDYKYIEDEKIAGIISVKMTQDKKPVGTDMPKEIKYSSLSDLYEIYKFKGDAALVIKTDILKKFIFPKIDGEKFVGEEYIYCQIDEKYKSFLSNKRYYICEYLEDGYTSNMFKLISNNPKGYMQLKNMKLKVSKRFIIKYKSASLYIVGCWLSNEKKIIRKSNNKIITLISYPLAIAVYMVRFRKIKREQNF